MVDATLVQAAQVSKRFPLAMHPAIANLNLHIPSAQVTGLVGPDGAGKTTLMRLLAGLMLPDSGEIKVCGFSTVTQLTEIRQVASYMPQRFGLYEDLTVQENLNLYADLRGVVGDARRQAFEKLLSFTNLGPFTSRLAGRLSGGMKQKLGLACALIHTPRLLLLDEPSVGVDPISRRELWQMVYQLVDDGLGVVWSTAYLDEAERCASVVLINEGQTLYSGSPQELTDRVHGRTFLVQNIEANRRQVLTKSLMRPGIVDGVIQGNSVRLVIADSAAPPTATDLGVSAARIIATTPRFEDAFVDLLGGGPKGASPLSELFAPNNVTSSTMIDAQGLTKKFGSFTAADQVTFQVQRGEIFGLLGPNGAGKSTTFKMLCGLLRPTSGTARVAGFDLHRAGGTARRQLGYMAQKFSLYGDLSVQQNLDFFAGIYGLSGHEQRQATHRMVEAFRLQPYLRINSGQIPLGFKQRLALSCALMHRPSILFLDEPTSGVDPLTRREFWSHINALVEQGVTVLVTTHFMDEAEYCDRIGLVYRGRIIAMGSPDELKSSSRQPDCVEPTLEQAFITLVERHDKNHDDQDRGVQPQRDVPREDGRS